MGIEFRFAQEFFVSTLAETLAQAKAHHRSGQLRDAEQLYRRVLQGDSANVEVLGLLGEACLALGQLSDAAAILEQAIRLEPNNAQAHNGLGAILGRQGKLNEASDCFRRAVELKPDFAEAYYNLAAAAALQGRFEEAAASSRRTLELKPDFAPAHNILGTALDKLGRLDEAGACFRRALELKGDFVDAHNNLGAILQRQGQLDEAAQCIRRALDLKPDFAAAHANLGAVLQSQQRHEEAAASIRRALELKPDYAEGHNNLGTVLQQQLRLDEAAASYRRALDLKPDYAEAHFNLGAVLAKQEQFDEAAASYRRAMELKPHDAEVHNGLAVVLAAQHKLDEAAACSRRALELKPEYAEAHFNYALTLLLMGRLAEGWREYEWRLKRKGEEQPALAQPRWTGSPPAGRTILLRSEQGLGDTLQFIRYAEVVRQQGATVKIEVPRSLVPLLEQSGLRGLVVEGTPLGDFDFHVPLMSLLGIFGTTLESIPGGVPYISAKEHLVERWRDVLRATDDFKIGIVWQGNPSHPTDRYRSIPLAHFAPLAQNGVELISLQQGFGCEQLAGVRGKFVVRELGEGVDKQHGAFMDTAAIIKNLDLVVTCDSAVAHLAGAMGARVWVPLAFLPDFRWMLARADSPWYPTMRLFRQSVRGDWSTVFQGIARELSSVLKNRGAP